MTAWLCDHSLIILSVVVKLIPPGMNEVWDAWVAPEAAPARATVQVTRLADPGWKLGE